MYRLSNVYLLEGEREMTEDNTYIEELSLYNTRTDILT